MEEAESALGQGVRAPENEASEADEAGLLREQIGALEQQIQQLVRTEQRLFRYQKELDRQLTRINVVNHFALEAATAFEARQIIDIAMRALMSVLALDQGIGFLVQEEALVRPVCVRSQPGMELSKSQTHVLFRLAFPAVPSGTRDPLIGTAAEIMRASGALPSILERVLPIFGIPDESSICPPQRSALYVVLPLRGQRASEMLGLVLFRKADPSSASVHERLPAREDIPFIQLFCSHLECTLENALLHERLSRLAAQLEQRVASRTLELSSLNKELQASLEELKATQGQLFQASKMAAIGTLVAGLSHELNNPMGVILGYAQTLLQCVELDDPIRPGLTAIERQAERCKHLVGSLLDFSRHKTTNRESIDANAIVGRVYDLARAQARCDQVDFRVEASSQRLPHLLANATEIESALLNLVNNAVDAAGQEGRVSLQVYASTEGGRTGVEFIVQDNGPGIAPDVQPWIFDPFFTTKAVGRGTGLGLTLAKRIIDAHEGKITFISSPERGTTVRVWLPAF